MRKFKLIDPSLNGSVDISPGDVRTDSELARLEIPLLSYTQSWCIYSLTEKSEIIIIGTEKVGMKIHKDPILTTFFFYFRFSYVKLNVLYLKPKSVTVNESKSVIGKVLKTFFYNDVSKCQGNLDTV